MVNQSPVIHLQNGFLVFQNNLKNLDPSYRMDLDFGIILEEKI